jgi:hypothetical protein
MGIVGSQSRGENKTSLKGGGSEKEKYKMGRHKSRVSERPSGECEMLKVNHQLKSDLSHWLMAYY